MTRLIDDSVLLLNVWKTSLHAWLTRCCYHWSTNAWSPSWPLTFWNQVKKGRCHRYEWCKEPTTVGLQGNDRVACQQPEPPFPFAFSAYLQKAPHNNRTLPELAPRSLPAGLWVSSWRNPDRASDPSHGGVKKHKIKDLSPSSWLHPDSEFRK